MCSTPAAPSSLIGGAHDPDGASVQLSRLFRAALEAMAKPGAPTQAAFDAAPAPLSPAAGALIWTLSDADATVWTAPSRRTPEIDQFIRFRTGAAPESSPENADFFIGRWQELFDAPAAIGDPEYPDRSTTLIVEVDGFGGGPTAELSGPGLAKPLELSIAGVDHSFWPYASRNAALFPLGVDMFLCAGDQIVGLPRSTQPNTAITEAA